MIAGSPVKASDVGNDISPVFCMIVATLQQSVAPSMSINSSCSFGPSLALVAAQLASRFTCSISL